MLREIIILMSVLLWSGVAMAAETFTIVPLQSRIEIKTGKAGLLKSVAHEHLVHAEQITGSIVFDKTVLAESMIALTVPSASLKLDATKVDPKDAREIEETMEGKKVLDVARYPTIQFESRELSGQETAPHQYALELVGDLSMHGVTRSITVPVTVHITGNTLIGSGATRIKQTDFGIKPYSAALGTIKVKDELQLVFSITAQQ